MNIHIIGTHHGNHCIGNSKYYFKFLYHKKPEYTFLLSKNKNTILELRKSYPSKNILYAYSLRTILILARSKHLYMIAGPIDFFPYRLSILKSKNIINLFHGTALKDMKSEEASAIYQKYLSGYCVCSEKEQKSIAKMFSLDINKVWITGLPKNDPLVVGNNKLDPKNEKIILYAPTFRDDGSKINLFPFPDMNFDALENVLEKHNAVIELRLHINSIKSINDPEYIKSKRIRFSNPYIANDTQILLKKTSILITDYSGIFFDFLLLDRPCMFIPYDFDEYKKVRDFQFPYYESTPGPKIESCKDFIDYIDMTFSNPNHDQELRKSGLEMFHTYKNSFSERIYKRVSAL